MSEKSKAPKNVFQVVKTHHICVLKAKYLIKKLTNLDETRSIKDGRHS